MNLHHFDSNVLKERFLARKQTVIFCFCTVFFWGLLAHAYGFLHSSLSHDVLNAFIATSVEECVKLEVGRYLVPIYRALFRGPVMMPWLIGMLGLAWTAMALVLVTLLFNTRSRVLTFLVGGIMTTNLAYIAQIATFLHEFDCNALALLLAVLGVYVWNLDKKYWSVPIGGLCLMTSISIYQAFFAVAVTLIVWKSMMDLLEGTEVPKVFGKGVRGILTILVGGLFYLLLGKLVGYVAGSTLQSRTNALNMNGENPIAVYLGLIKPMVSYLGRNLMHKQFYSTAFDLCVYAVVALIGLLSIRVFVVKQYRFDRTLLILALLVVLPFAMTCVFFLAKGEEMHDLTTYVIWLFYALILILAFHLCQEKLEPDWKARVVRGAACILVVVVLWQNVLMANTAYIKKELEADTAMSIMTRVAARMEEREDYIPEETPIAFIGTPQHGEVPYGMERLSFVAGLHSESAICRDTSIPYYNAYKAYFDYVLQIPARFCSNEMHSELKSNERVLAMPNYPHKDSMAMIDGVLVIKMGDPTR